MARHFRHALLRGNKVSNYRFLSREIGIFWDNSDVYGSLMGAWFPLAWILEYERSGCPESWRYRPGAGASELEEETTDLMYVEIYREYPTDTLERLGERFNRLYRRLHARGDTY